MVTWAIPRLSNIDNKEFYWDEHTGGGGGDHRPVEPPGEGPWWTQGPLPLPPGIVNTSPIAIALSE